MKVLGLVAALLLAAPAYGQEAAELVGIPPTGTSTVTKFGRNPDVDAGFEAIWNGGGAYTGFDAVVGDSVEVFSSSALDDSGGVGAWVVVLDGLSAAYVAQRDTVVLNGTGHVQAARQFLRCPRAWIISAGDSLRNVGAITVRQMTDTAVVFIVMPADYNQTMIAAYTIPAGKTGWIRGWYVATANKIKADHNVRLRARPFGEVFQVKEEISIHAEGTGFIHRIYPTLKGPFAARTDIYVEADSDAANAAVSAGFDLLLMD